VLVLNGSNLYTARVRLTGSNLICAPRTSFGIFARASTMLGVTGLDKTASIPHGLRGGVATSMARTDGGLASYLSGSGATTTVGADAIGDLGSSLTGSGTVSFGNLAGGKNLAASLTGSGSISNAPLPAFGNIACSISIGARPSAFDIAQAVWEELLAGHTTAGTAAKTLKDKLSRNDYIGLS
jgi:hypothetical protein